MVSDIAASCCRNDLDYCMAVTGQPAGKQPVRTESERNRKCGNVWRELQARRCRRRIRERSSCGAVCSRSAAGADLPDPRRRNFVWKGKRLCGQNAGRDTRDQQAARMYPMAAGHACPHRSGIKLWDLSCGWKTASAELSGIRSGRDEVLSW